MRFKKGSRVEVMNKDVPASGRVAENISGNGHTYDLRFSGSPGVEKVPKKFIRPCPPSIGSQSWATGDIVEVFDENTWKTARVSRVLSGSRFLVRPHGCTHEIIVYKTNIRVRQSLREGQLVPVKKISGSYGDVRKICHKEDDCLAVYNDARLHEPRVASSKKLKRASLFCSSLLESCPGKPKRFKAAEKEHSERHFPGYSFEKVDAFAHLGDTLGKKYMKTNFKNSLNGYYEMEKRKKNGAGCTFSRISEPNESDDDECSVGSCSVPSDGLNKLSSSYYQATDNLSSDAESFNTSRDEEEAEVSIHRLELNAYRSTLEALYASGPLSWEKEALLTNLRINLHISNDEHSTELRHLISPRDGILG